MTFKFDFNFAMWDQFANKNRTGTAAWSREATALMNLVGDLIIGEVYEKYATEALEGVDGLGDPMAFHAYPAITTGEYGRSLVKQVAGEQSVTVSATAPYAGFLEEGTAGHRPPRWAIEQWAEDKGIEPIDEEGKDVIGAIIYAIAQRGTPARYFISEIMNDAFVRGMINGEIRKTIDVLAASMGWNRPGGDFAVSSSGRTYYARRGAGGRFAKRGS